MRETLNSYVEDLTKAMESYEHGKIASEWSCNSQTSECSPTDNDSLDDIRHYCGQLNSMFCECVTYNGASLGIFFGVLSSNLIGYSRAKKRGEDKKSQQIKDRMFNHIQKIK